MYSAKSDPYAEVLPTWVLIRDAYKFANNSPCILFRLGADHYDDVDEFLRFPEQRSANLLVANIS